MIKNRVLPLLKDESFLYLLIVLFIYLSVSLFFISYYPVYIDEALTYNLFSSKSFYFIVSNYPFPNNHVFYSIITKVFSYLPFDLLINIRLPNLLIGVVTSIVVYKYLKENFGHKLAIIPHVILTFSYCFLFYTTFARGYMIIISVNILCFICIEKLQLEFKNKYLIYVCILSSIGFFTIPIFLYCSVSHAVLLFFFFYKDVKKLFWILLTYFFLGIGVVLCYLPIIFHEGLSAITDNEFTSQVSFNEILLFFKSFQFIGIFDKITGISVFLFFLFLVLFLFFSLFISQIKREKGRIIFVISSICLPFVFITVQQVIPGGRTWSYLIFPICLGITIIISFISQKVSIINRVIYFLAVCIIFLQLSVFYKTHPKATIGSDFKMQQLSTYLINHKVKSIYIDMSYPYSGEQMEILFEYLRRNKEVHFYNKNCNEREFILFDCLFLVPENDHKQLNYTEISNSPYFDVFIKSDLTNTNSIINNIKIKKKI